MKNLFKLISLPVFCLVLFGCVSRQEGSVKRSAGKTNLNVEIVGVGYTEDIALTDSYSTYNAVRNGVSFIVKNGEIKLHLLSGALGQPSIETMTNSRVERLGNAFYLYSYPYSAEIEISGYRPVHKSVSIPVEKPFSFLSKMLAKAVMDEYGLSKKKIKGRIYIMKLERQVQPAKGIVITADLVLCEDEPEKAR